MVDMKTPGHRHPPAARAHRPGDVQRGVLRRRVRARGLPRRPEHDGWRCGPHDARQRAGLHGSGNTIGGGVVGVLQRGRGARAWPTTASRSPRPAASSVTGHALAVLGFRLTLAALAGADPSGSEAAVRKLLGVQHDQHVQEVGHDASPGIEATATEGDAARVVGVVPVQPVPDDRRRHQRRPAQRDRRAPARPAPGSVSPDRQFASDSAALSEKDRWRHPSS